MSTSTTPTSSRLCDQIVTLGESCLSPKLNFPLEEINDEDVTNFFNTTAKPNISEIEKALENILLRIESDLDNLNSQSFNAKSLGTILILVGEHKDETRLWSSGKTGSLVTRILMTINRLQECNIETSSHLETYSVDTVAKNIISRSCSTASHSHHSVIYYAMQILHARLKKDTWKLYPAAIQAYRWLLLTVCDSHISDFVDMFFPPALLLTDDYNPQNTEVGIECLTRIIRNSNAQILQKQNWGNVVYDALRNQFSSKSTDTIDKLVPAILITLSIIEKNPSSNPDKWTRYDNVMNDMIFATTMSSDLKLQKVWLRHIMGLIEIQGLGVLHSCDRIVEMLSDCIGTSDSEIWSLVVQTAIVCLRNTWVKPNSKQLLTIIVKIIYNYRVFNVYEINESNDIIRKHVNVFFQLLKAFDDPEVKTYFDELKTNGKDVGLNPLFLDELNLYNL